MDISQWELSSIVNLHRSCGNQWLGHLHGLEDDKEDQEIVTVEINSQGVYSKMR